MKIKTYTGKQLARSTKTRFIGGLDGHDIYSHKIRTVSGHYVVLAPENPRTNTRDWVSYETYDEAKHAVLVALKYRQGQITS